MKRNVFVTILVALLITGSMASTAFSQIEHHRRHQGLRLPFELMEKLTEQQIQKLQALQFELQKEMIALQSQMQIKRLETQQLWRADELDENAILEKTKEIAQLQSQQHKKAVRHRLQTAQILTKEQRDGLIQSEHFGHRPHCGNKGHRTEGHHRYGGRAPNHRGHDDKGADDGRDPHRVDNG